MKKLNYLSVWAALASTAALAEPLTFPQTRGAEFKELNQYQAIGRAVVDPSGRFFIYEWARPYLAVPEWEGAPEQIRRRMQTSIYEFSISEVWLSSPAGQRFPRASHKLFPSHPGSTYYLGSLSPDSTQLSFYELNWDKKAARLGVVRLGSTGTGVPNPVIWFDSPIVLGRLEQLPEWNSNDELMFPAGAENGVAVAHVGSGLAEICTGCVFPACPKPRVRSPQEQLAGNGGQIDNQVVLLPQGAERLASSQDESLVLFSVSSASELSLLFRYRDGSVTTVFANKRF